MELSPRFLDALRYVIDLHGDQRRKVSGSPYVVHLLAVAAIVLDNGADEEEAIAALLHDAIEDGGGDAVRQEIGRRFGARVVAIVDGCTDTDQVPKPPWRARKEAHLRQLRDASASVRLIVAADKLDNARALRNEYRTAGASLWTHFRGGREGTLWYFRAVIEILAESGPSPLLEQLGEAVSQLEALQ